MYVESITTDFCKDTGYATEDLANKINERVQELKLPPKILHFQSMRSAGNYYYIVAIVYFGYETKPEEQSSVA